MWLSCDLAKQLRTIKNHIKRQLLYYGIKLPEQFDKPNWSREMKTWIGNLQWMQTAKQKEWHHQN